MLHVDLEVVLQVLADAGEVVRRPRCRGLEVGRRAHARELEQLRRVDGAAAQHDLAGARDLHRAACRACTPRPPRACLRTGSCDEGARAHVEVAAAHDRVQVGPGGGEPPPAVDVAVEGREPLLAVAVHVIGELVPGLLHRFEERAEQRARGGPALERERSGVRRGTSSGVGGQARSPCA